MRNFMFVLRAGCLLLMIAIVAAWCMEEHNATTTKADFSAARSFLAREQLPEALACYHRVLAQQPSHHTAQQGRDFCRKELGVTGFDTLLAERVSVPQLFFWCVVGSLLFLACSVSRTWYAIAAKILACVAWLLIFGVVVVMVLQDARSKASPIRIVRESVPLRVGNAESFGMTKQTKLTIGSEVRLLHQRGAWCLVAMPDDVKGWLPTASLVPEPLE